MPKELPSLAAVIAQVESGDNPLALRFEPSTFDHWRRTTNPGQLAIIAAIRKIHDCSAPTAMMIAATSFGRWQVMGFNLWDPAGFDWKLTLFDYIDELSIAVDTVLKTGQRASFDHYVNRHGVDYPLEEIVADEGKRLRFIGAYNGHGAMEDYWAKMQTAMSVLG